MGGIWPLPGGYCNYAKTLQSCLDFIEKKSPIREELRKWFTDNFPSVKGGIAVDGYIFVIKNTLQLCHEDYYLTGKITITKKGEEYLKSKDPELLFKILESRVSGMSELLEILESGPMNRTEINNSLKNRLDKNWKKTNQTVYRLGWLMSVEKVKLNKRQFSLNKKST